MTKKTNSLTRLLLFTSLIVVLVAVFFIPSVHRRYSAWFATSKDTVIRYIPHIAPIKSWLGKYEQAQVPFVFAIDANTDAIILDHHWTVDLEKHTYHTVANGYKHARQADGSYIDFPMHVDETNSYDTLHTWKQSGQQLPAIAGTPSIKPLPDSLHLPGADEEAKAKALWRKLRKVKLPYTYKPDPNMTLTVLRRKIWVESTRDSLFLYTQLTSIEGPFGTKVSSTDTITIEARETIE